MGKAKDPPSALAYFDPVPDLMRARRALKLLKTLGNLSLDDMWLAMMALPPRFLVPLEASGNTIQIGSGARSS